MQHDLLKRKGFIYLSSLRKRSRTSLIKMDKIIIFLIISDVLILSAFGLINPIFAIFMKEGISGGSVVAAGIASTIFFLVKSMIQLPLSIYIDKRRDKIGFLLLGTLIIVSVPILYAFSKNVNFVYFVQGLYGVGAAMAYPAWYSLFVMHLDRKHRGFEYSIWSTGVGIGTALTAFLGAMLVKNFGFKNVFFIVSGISFLGLVFLIFLSRKYLRDIEKVEHFLIPKSEKK